MNVMCIPFSDVVLNGLSYESSLIVLTNYMYQLIIYTLAIRGIQSSCDMSSSTESEQSYFSFQASCSAFATLNLSLHSSYL